MHEKDYGGIPQYTPGPMQRWDLFELRSLVRKLYGEAASVRVYRFAVSFSKRIAFAKYHHSEVFRLLANELAEMDIETAALFVMSRVTSYDTPEYQAVAALTAFFQCLHPLEDYLAHMIYHGLNMDVDPKLRIDPRSLYFRTVKDKLPNGALRDRVVAMWEDEELGYVRNFANHIKHENVVDVNVQVSFPEERHGLWIQGFTQDRVSYFATWAAPRLEAAFYAMQNHGLGIGLQLNQDLEALHRSLV